MISAHGSAVHLEQELSLNARTPPTGDRWEVVIRRATEIPPEFLELVGEVGRGYGYLKLSPGMNGSGDDAAPQGPGHLVIHGYGRTLLEHLLAAVRRTLPGSAVRARRLGRG